MPFQNLYNNIFDTNEPGENQVEMLERQVKRYPYFTLAHFFLLKQTELGHPAYAGIAAKTAIHFNHPFFLHEQLLKRADEQVTTDNKYATVFHTPDVFTEEMMEIADASRSSANGAAKGALEAAIPQDILEEKILVVEEQDAVNDHADVELNVTEDTEDKKQIVEVEAPGMLPQSTQLEPLVTTGEEVAYENGRQEKMQPPAKEEMVFEPLFATDYFASQGIKLRDDAVPNDKLGKQLRSFTDWLKTMKKVHEGKLPAGSETLDLSVQKLAEKSNREGEVITETMAEVYLQQGKQQKAKEIYEKLSLLNPSRIAYFAAKIAQIQ